MRKAACIVAAIVAAAVYWRASAPVEVEDRRAEAACLAAYSVVRTPALVPEPEPEPHDVQQSAAECSTVVQPVPPPPPRTRDSAQLTLTRELTYACSPCRRLGTIQWPLDKSMPSVAKCKVCGGSMYRDRERKPSRRRRACRT